MLRHDATHLTLAPHLGGAICEFSWRDWNVLRSTATDADDDPFGTACFPIAPFANRVADGRFSFGGRAVRLARNWDQDPHPLHGQGWGVPWMVL